jgi:hypothetical protein
LTQGEGNKIARKRKEEKRGKEKKRGFPVGRWAAGQWLSNPVPSCYEL